MDDDVQAEIERYLSLPRTHASAFNWHDKVLKELGVVESFLKASAGHSLHDFVDYAPACNDPPDVLMLTSTGAGVGLELVELVNAEAIAAQIERDKQPTEDARARYAAADERLFSPDALWAETERLVGEKLKKCRRLFEGGAEVSLLIHSDETGVYCKHAEFFASPPAMATSPFRDVFFLVSYDPSKKGCTAYRIGGRA